MQRFLLTWLSHTQLSDPDRRGDRYPMGSSRSHPDTPPKRGSSRLRKLSFHRSACAALHRLIDNGLFSRSSYDLGRVAQIVTVNANANVTENGPLSSCFPTCRDVYSIRLGRQREQDEHRKRVEAEDAARREGERHKRERAQEQELREALERDRQAQLQVNQYGPQAGWVSPPHWPTTGPPPPPVRVSTPSSRMSSSSSSSSSSYTPPTDRANWGSQKDPGSGGDSRTPLGWLFKKRMKRNDPGSGGDSRTPLGWLFKKRTKEHAAEKGSPSNISSFSESPVGSSPLQ